MAEGNEYIQKFLTEALMNLDDGEITEVIILGRTKDGNLKLMESSMKNNYETIGFLEVYKYRLMDNLIFKGYTTDDPPETK